jgi:hypothetical protein
MSRKKRRAADSKVQQPKPQQRAYDAFANAMARTGFSSPSLLEGTQYPLTRMSFDYTLLQSLYRSHWIIRRIIDTVPEDCCKNWIQLKTQVNPDMLERLNKLERKAMIKARLIEGMKWGRLFGGAGAIMMIEGHESILDQPLDYDTIMPGAFCGLLVRDRWSGLSPGPDLITNPRDPEYGLPEKYLVTTNDGKTFTVHHSRLLRFIGRDVPFWEKQAESYWGVSEVEHIYEELKKRDNTSWNIANLIFRAYLITLKMKDLEQTLAVGDEQAKKDLYNIVQAQNWLMSNQGMLMMGQDDSLDTKSYSFAGLSDIYDKFCLDIAGAAEIPVTKLFGRSPAGMNATGESDMQNYDDKISQNQEAYLGPVIDKLLPVMCMSEWGYIPDDLDYTFNPNRTMNNKDKADYADKACDTIGKAYDRGIISHKTTLKEYRQLSDVTGIFTNITDDDIDNADDTTQQGEMLPDLSMLDINPPEKTL